MAGCISRENTAPHAGGVPAVRLGQAGSLAISAPGAHPARKGGVCRLLARATGGTISVAAIAWAGIARHVRIAVIAVAVIAVAIIAVVRIGARRPPAAISGVVLPGLESPRC